MAVKEIQLGKNGITQNFIVTLKSYFEKNRIVKVSVLKSARENKEQVKEFAEILKQKLGEHFTAKVIGFTIIIQRWKKPVKDSEVK